MQPERRKRAERLETRGDVEKLPVNTSRYYTVTSLGDEETGQQPVTPAIFQPYTYEGGGVHQSWCRDAVTGNEILPACIGHLGGGMESDCISMLPGNINEHQSLPA